MSAIPEGSPERIAPVRQVLHYAAQLPGAVGNSWLTPEEDDTHTTLAWDAELGAFMTRTLGLEARVGLRFARPAWLVALPDGTTTELPVHGTSPAEAAAWVTDALSPLLGRDPAPLEARDYGLAPRDPALPFSIDDLDAAAALGEWFAHANATLHDIRPEGASIVRMWPHHFDIAVLDVLDADEDLEEARSVNIGLSPGDGGIAVPYWYVVPWPRPESEVSLPALPSGRWETEGWTGAVLDAHAMQRGAGEGEVRAFLSAAIHTCRTVLGG